MSVIDLVKNQDTDANKWASAFMAKIEREFPGVDHGTMLAWFANAIEVGRLAGGKKEYDRSESACMIGENHIMIESFIDGEGFHVLSSVPFKLLEDIEALVKHDFIDDLTREHPIRIKLVTSAEKRETEISGIMYDGWSRKNAERMADGLEAIVNEHGEDAYADEEDEIEDSYNENISSKLLKDEIGEAQPSTLNEVADVTGN